MVASPKQSREYIHIVRVSKAENKEKGKINMFFEKKIQMKHRAQQTDLFHRRNINL